MPDLWYQEANINGVDMPTVRHKDSSRRRWKQFIEPLIPQERGRAIDLGCNAGFYCRELADLGYNVTGMDMDTDHALLWEANHPKGVTILKGDINAWDPPYAHLALAACVLYWQDQHSVEALVERLRHRVAHMIVMSRNKEDETHLSNGELSHMELVFRLWRRGRAISRGKHYSVIFHNRKIYPMDTKDLVTMTRRGKIFTGRLNMLIDLVLSGKPFNPEETAYYAYLREKAVTGRFPLYVGLIKSVMENGILVPIRVCNDLVIDGAHRIMLAKYFGIKNLLCEDTSIG